MANKSISYEYSKITQQGIIRLILLQPSPSHEAPLACSLIDVSLKDCDNDILEHYVALSYVWGDATQKGSISIDGKFLEITASLELGLRYIRDKARVLRIWADGVCIDQNDVKDRNTQVTVMASIYSAARHTIIFLGPGIAKHESLLARMVDSDSTDEVDYDTESFKEVADDVLAHAWFERVWVLQELVLSPDPWVQLGRVRMRWDHFLQYMSKETDVRSSRQELLHGMVQIRSNHQVQRHNTAGTGWFQPATMLDILEARRGLGVTDPRDMVYAHLGMAEPSVRSGIDVDYSKSKAKLYEEIATQVCDVSRDLSILSFVEDVDLEKRLDLASWVPDWSVTLQSSRVPIEKAFRGGTLNLISFNILYGLQGVLSFEGQYHGTVVEFLPRGTLLCRDRHTVHYYDDSLMERIFELESVGIVSVLLTYFARLDKSWFKSQGLVHYLLFERCFNQRSSDRSWLGDKEGRRESSDKRVQHSQLMSDMVQKLPLSTKNALEEKFPDSIQLVEIVYAFISDMCGRLSDDADNQIALVRCGEDLIYYCVPKHARVNDILGCHPLHREIFLFRPHLHGKDPTDCNEFLQKARKKLTTGARPLLPVEAH
ncbi:HET-domain-containing protein [Mollisia scopiformis]|uniref:HET-domain-containing protein n=1 Tax=Mollisia scopiformis TaxID=149040 RepID=A0A194X8R5_MOLSC|nr:HET-domain-containing protein [Mollisia scopiformis]KUJ16504.1 HET-domain-containing protein [Mollisia scopiformis]